MLFSFSPFSGLTGQKMAIEFKNSKSNSFTGVSSPALETDPCQTKCMAYF